MNESDYITISSDNSTLYNIDCNNLYRDSIFSSTWFQSFIYVIYSSVFFIALVGNGLVCYVVYRNPRMRTVTNYFIVNLAVGDILMDLFCVPTSAISTLILQYWPFGPELCPSVNYAQAVSVLVSAYTLVAISIDRYMAIMWPLRPRMGKKYAKLSIFAVWMLALIISFPIPVVSRMQQPAPNYEYCNLYVCQEYWPSADQKYNYSVALLILQFVVPLLVMAFTYTSITLMVWGKRPPGEAENTRDERMARSKRKVSPLNSVLSNGSTEYMQGAEYHPKALRNSSVMSNEEDFEAYHYNSITSQIRPNTDFRNHPENSSRLQRKHNTSSQEMSAFSKER